MTTQYRERLQLSQNCKEQLYREGLVRSAVTDGISLQIKTLRNRLGWTQRELADRAGMKQSTISRLESSDYTGYTAESLLRLARAFDVGLQIGFVSFSSLIDQEVNAQTAPQTYGEDTAAQPSQACASARLTPTTR